MVVFRTGKMAERREVRGVDPEVVNHAERQKKSPDDDEGGDSSSERDRFPDGTQAQGEEEGKTQV